MSYVLRHHAFWAKAENARRLDEVEEASNVSPKFRLHAVRHGTFCFKMKCLRANIVQADVAELPKKPKSLLERLERRRKKRPGSALHRKTSHFFGRHQTNQISFALPNTQVCAVRAPGPRALFPEKDSFHNCSSANVRLAAERAKKDKPFEHLQRIPPLPVPGEPWEFRVLSSEVQVREAAERLKNCAASYIPDVVAQKCALVGLFEKQKGDGNKMSTIIAMGELFAEGSVSDGRIVTSWGQRVEACNESLTKAQKQHFKRARQGFSQLWTKAVQDEIDAVLPRQAAGERVIAKPVDQRLLAFRHLSVLGRRVALIKLARVIESEGYTPERKSLAQGFVEHALNRRMGGTIPDVIVGSCLAIAGKARDSSLLRTIMGTMAWRKLSLPRTIMGTTGLIKLIRKEGDLTMKQWTDFWLSDLPMDPGILAEEMCRLLRTLPEQEKEATELAGRVVGRLLTARLGKDELHSVARSVFATVRQLDGNAKLTVLLSDLPFQKSDLMGTLMSAAKARDASLVDGIISRLLKAGVGPQETKEVLQQALRLDKDTKLLVLLSDLPFQKSDLMGALTEQLMSAAKARDASLADRIISRLLKAGVGPKETKEVLKQALRLDKHAKLLVLLSDLPFQKSDLMGTLMSAAKARDASLADRTISRLLKAGVGPQETKEALQQALRLDKDAKLLVLLSDLPFQKSDLMGTLMSAAKARDASLVDGIISRLLKAGVGPQETKEVLQQALRLDKDAKLLVLLSDLPFQKSDLMGTLTEQLMSAAKARDALLADRIISRLLKAGVGPKETKEVLKQALRLDKHAKLLVLLSDLPFQKSDLMCALTEQLMSAAKARDASLAERIISRLLKAGVGPKATKEVLKQALRLGNDAKLLVLLSDLPFQKSDLMGTLTEQLMSAAMALDSSLADRIISRLLKAGVGPKATKEVLKQALRLDKDAKLLVLLSDLPFQKSDLMCALTEQLMSAAKARDASLADRIISRLLKAGVGPKATKEVLKQALRLEKDAKLLVLLSDLPFQKSDLMCALTEQLMSAAMALDSSLADRIISRLLRAGVGPKETKELLQQALRLDKDAKLLVLLSDLPFQKSDLKQAFVEAFCEQADLGNYHFLKLLEKRLLDLALTSDETSVILDGALSLPTRAKLAVLLSELPFAASQLVEASIEPLLSAAKAHDVYLAGSITSRLLKAGVAASQTSGILEVARKLNMAAKLVILLSPLPFRSDDLVEALRNPLLSAADARAVKVVQSITERLLRANVEAAQTTGTLEEAVKLKPSARLILLLSDLPFVASPSLQHFLTRFLFMFSKQHGAKTSAIVKLIGTKLSACGMKKADADSILRSGIISGTSAQLRVLISGLPFHSGTVRRLVPELASSLVEAAARKDTELVEEAERVLRHRGIRASHTSSFLMRACHARCYSFIVHSTLPFEPRVLTSSLADAYLRELVEGTHSENEFVQRYCSATEIEMALSRAGANQVAFLACVLLLAADTLPPDAPVIRHLMDQLVHIGITTPAADYVMDRVRPELSRLLNRRM